MKYIALVPELNFWMIRILKNSPMTDTFHRIPSVISDYWREPNSVLELMFNENFHPDLYVSSSSTSSFDQDKPYIYLYRTCNLAIIPDKNIIYRTQMYRWFATIYAVNSNKFIDIFDETGSLYPPTEPGSDIVFDSGLDYLEAASDTVPTLPFDINEADRSPHITYTTKNYVTTNYPLVQHGTYTSKPWPPVPPIPPSHNVFGFTEDDLMMLDMLYDYKVYNICNLTGVNFNSLRGCIARLIYIYLAAFCLNDYTYADTENPISDGSDILCTLYEKYVIDMIYQLRAKQYGVIWKPTDVINDEIVEENVYHMMIMKKSNMRITLTDQMIIDGEVILTDEIPYNRADFTLYKDGAILEQDKDYRVVMDYSNPADVVARVKFLNTTFVEGENLEFIWSYVDPYSAYSETDE